MTNNKALVAALAASTALVFAGLAVAETQAAPPTPPAQSAVEKSFNKLSADGQKAFQDLMITRVAIFDGDTAKAKTTIDEAAAAFDKAKTDESVFTKSEHDLMTPQQMAAKHAKMADAKTADAKTVGAESTDTKTPDASTAASDATSNGSADAKTASSDIKTASNDTKTASADTAVSAPKTWLPVDGAVSLDEDYTLSPTKTKAVADANATLKKGDRQGALDRLKLADVGMSVALEVVPLDATLDDVHQAAKMINDGKFYEGSQLLRKVEDSARFDVSDYTTGPKGLSYSHASDTKAAGDKAPVTH